MPREKIPTVTIHGQTDALIVQVAQVRDSLQKAKPRDLPADTVPNLTHLIEMLGLIGKKVEGLETEHRNLAALAEIGNVVNSSLELDEVLRIVMDNIVR